MQKEKGQDWTRIVPRKLVGSELDACGEAIVLVPRFRKGFFAKWVQPRLKRPYHRVKLDRLGSFVWNMLDGTADFSKISAAMKEEFGENLAQSEERLTKFLTILSRNKFVELLTPL